MQLVIVRPGEYATFNRLMRAFEDDPHLHVIWDRRGRQDRRHARAGASAERRRQERRQPPPSIWQQRKYVVADATPDRLGARHHEDQSGSLDATVLNTFSGIQDSIQCAVQSDVPVLISHGAAIDRIQLATTIHGQSRRQHGPFVVHDVRSGEEALDRQLTASANGGTLFVVEIAALEHRMQCTLLRWLDKRVDSDAATPIPRVIAGTGEQLFTRVSENDFDVTLFYRLNVIHLVLPEEDDNRKARQANTVTSSITI